MADSGVPKDFSKMPGPYGLPLLGSAVSLASFPSPTQMEWADKYYGNVFRYRMLSSQCVCLNGYDAIREGLVTNRSKLSGRMANPFLRAVRNNRGLFFLDYGELWSKWRPIIVGGTCSIMPDFHSKIETQAQKFLDDITRGSPEANPINMKDDMRYRLAQVAVLSFLNKEFDSSSRKEFNDLILDIYSPFSSIKFVFGLFAPILAYIPPFRGFIAEETCRREKVIQTFVRWIEERLTHLEQKSDSEDIASIYFKENPKPSSDDLEQMATILMDWIFAGSKTVTEEIHWMILFLLKNPDDLKRLQNELDAAMKNTENVAELYKNQEKVPFFNAVIQETTRLRPIAPGSLYHKSKTETVVGGYKIPKDVVIVANLWSIHHDPEFWGPDAAEFRPARHLDSKGKFQKSDRVVPFSIGERSCAGERISRAEFFIFVATLLLSYDISLAEGSEDTDMNGVSAAILKTVEYEVILKRRRPKRGSQ